MATAFVNGVNIYYEEYGSGPAMVLTSGFTGTTKAWSPQIPALSQNHRLILHDLRGHGQSDAPADRALYSWDTTIEDLYQLLNHLGVEKAIVGGLSLGGLVSLNFYLRHPEMTAALILASTGPGFRSAESRAQWDEGRLKLSEALESGGMEAYMKITAFSSDPEALASQDPIGLSNVNIALQTNQEMVALEKVKVPTLVIVGQLDTNTIPPTNYMHRKIKGSRMAVIPKANHVANVDQPEDFNRVVLEFLKDFSL
ncbi:MAG: alpha/beta hydrolase [Chloroflexi bacterium]|nr:alpha/beta hydrolase [Chloroflexota bacterium]